MINDIFCISDLDGTLLGSNATLHPFTRTVINSLPCNLRFTVATGRPYASIMNRLEGVNLRLPIISLNGGSITDPATGKRVYGKYLPPQAVDSILTVLQKNEILPFIYYNSHGEERMRCAEPSNDAMEVYLFEKKSQCPQILDEQHVDIPLDEVINITLFTRDKEGCHSLLAEIDSPEVAVVLAGVMYCDGWWEMTLQHKDANKGAAVLELLKYLSLPDAYTIAFGDSLNDIDMLKVVDKSIALNNALDEVKAIAVEVLERSNDEMAVASYLKSLSLQLGADGWIQDV